MITFDSFKPTDGVPIYLQIYYYILRGIVAGTIVDGDELPSRRVLSALLGINPNTVQKSFKLIEEDGLMESRTGAKSYMKLDPAKMQKLKLTLLEEDIRQVTGALKQMAISKEEALALISKYWEEI